MNVQAKCQVGREDHPAGGEVQDLWQGGPHFTWTEASAYISHFKIKKENYPSIYLPSFCSHNEEFCC